MELKKYVVRPSVKFFAGMEVKKETEFHEVNDNGSVDQTLKDLVLTTKINKEYGQYKTKEETTLIQELPEGTLLIWSEETGFIIPQYQMCTVERAIEDLKVLEG